MPEMLVRDRDGEMRPVVEDAPEAHAAGCVGSGVTVEGLPVLCRVCRPATWDRVTRMRGRLARGW